MLEPSRNEKHLESVKYSFFLTLCIGHMVDDEADVTDWMETLYDC